MRSGPSPRPFGPLHASACSLQALRRAGWLIYLDQALLLVTQACRRRLQSAPACELLCQRPPPINVSNCSRTDETGAVLLALALSLAHVLSSPGLFSLPILDLAAKQSKAKQSKASPRNEVACDCGDLCTSGRRELPTLLCRGALCREDQICSESRAKPGSPFFALSATGTLIRRAQTFFALWNNKVVSF